MKRSRQHSYRGFALPTVLIASVVMMTVLATAVASATASRASLQTQQYTQLARDAAESGVAMAQACITAGTTTWANDLRPGGTCTGLAAQCTTSNCYVLQTSSVRTTFNVTSPVVSGNATNVSVTGTVELLRESNGQVWRTYKQVIQKQDVLAAGGGLLRWKQVESGNSHTCGLSTTGLVYCWGLNTDGQLGDGTNSARTAPTLIAQGAIPAGATITQISVGYVHTCAIATDSEAYCWGSNGSGRLGDNSTSNRNTPVLVAQGAIPAGATIRQIAAGGGFSCAIASDNKPYCWGDNTNGKLGDNSTTQRLTPVAVAQGSMPAGSMVIQISAGINHACTIASNNRAYCWGLNTGGRLGDNTTTQRLTPTLVQQGAMPSGAMVTQVIAAGVHTCAIASDYEVYCWGQNTNSQVGDNSTTNRLTPVAVSQGGIPATVLARQITGGASHTCMLGTDNETYCWGLNTNGQLGDTTSTTRATPVATSNGAIPINDSINYITAGGNSNCQISSQSAIFCWGINTDGQHGNGNTTQANSPVATLTINDASTAPSLGLQVGTGVGHACTIASDEDVYCWGNNANGQLGNGSTTQSLTPVKVLQGAMPTNAKIRQVVAGTSHSCAIASDNKAYCWGLNSNGQLGNSTTTQSTTPVAVSLGAMPSGATAIQITAGSTHSCAIASNYQPYCWGFNSSGQLGNNSNTQATSPVEVNTLGGVIRQINAGSSHTCMVASDNRAYCWGLNTNGRLGDGTTTSKNYPVGVLLGAMPAGGLVRQVTGGATHSCAISSDNKPYCWGLNTNGQLGNGSTTQATSPSAVWVGAMPTGGMTRTITGGTSFTCAISSDNEAYCWGLNTNGQLGNNSTTQSTTPVAVAQGTTPAGSTIQQISAGSASACAISTPGKPYCWGLNTNGRLGNNSTTQSTTPVAVSNAPDYVLTAGGSYFFR